MAGIYLYDHHIFEAVKAITPSARGELEISDAHQYLIDKGLPGRLHRDHRMVEGHRKADRSPRGQPAGAGQYHPRHPGDVDETVARVAGKVIIEKGARIINSVVRGPAIIGERLRDRGFLHRSLLLHRQQYGRPRRARSNTASSCGTARSWTSASGSRGASSGMTWRSSRRPENRWCTGS